MFVSKLSALNHRRVRVRTHHTFRVIQNRHFRGARPFFFGGGGELRIERLRRMESRSGEVDSGMMLHCKLAQP